MSTAAAGPLARTPLRVKLVAALIGLLVLGLAITGVAAWATMRNYLLGQVDQTLERSAHAVQGPLEATGQFPCHNDPDGGALNLVYIQTNDSKGAVISHCAPGLGQDQSTPVLPAWTAAQASSREGHAFTVSSSRGGHDWRAYAEVLGHGEGVLYVATSLSDVERTVSQLLLIEIVGGVAVVILLGAVGYVIVRRSLRPLEEVEEAAGDIAEGDLTRRVPERDERTEVGRLSRAFNVMLGRIEGAFHEREASEAAARESEERMRRFVADASHELRTPLTSIRGFAELYRQGAVPGTAEVGRVMRRIEDQATRMGILVEDLLMLARLDQQRPLDLQPVDLATVAGEAVQDMRALDPGRPVRLVVDEQAGSTPVVLADETRLRQVVGNLVSNALVHTPAGAPVTLAVGSAGSMGRLDVTDEGPGMSAHDAEHAFERFYRADASRTRASGGTGLGLAIATALVTAQGGTLTLDTEPGRGSTFRVEVPLVGHAGAAQTHAEVPEPASEGT